MSSMSILGLKDLSIVDHYIYPLVQQRELLEKSGWSTQKRNRFRNGLVICSPVSRRAEITNRER